MQKINFQRGSVVPPNFLNELQNSIKFTATLRDDYYQEPTSQEQVLWDINSRDSIKGWELDERGVLGNLGYGGRVLGISGSNIIYGPASLTNLAPSYDTEDPTLFIGLNSDLQLTAGTFGLVVEKGSIISASGELQSWPRSFFEVFANTVYYVIYHSTNTQLELLQEIPPRGEQYALLARVTVGSSDVNNSVPPIDVQDLRPISQVDNLFNYQKTFTNTSIINSPTYTAASWQRVLIDSTNQSINVTLPADAQDGDRIILIDALNTFRDHPIVISPPTGILLQNSTSDWVINESGAIVELYYLEDFRSWRFTSKIDNQCDPVSGQFLQCGGEIALGLVAKPEDCPDGEALPVDPRYGISLGIYTYDPSTLKCTKLIDSKIAVYSNGEAEFNYEPHALRCGASREDFKNWLTN